jgi:hypothetical protein
MWGEMSEIWINLTLKIDGQGRTTATWRDNASSFPPYRLVTAWLESKIDRTRAALENLTSSYPQQLTDDSPVLAELAQRGHDLRNALFEDHDPEDRATAEEARDWFDSMPKEDVVVTINTDARLAIPWGVLHEHGDGAPPGQCYSGFWAPCFQVAASYSGMRIPPRGKSQGSAKLLAGKNEVIYAKTLEQLDPDQQQRIAEQLKRPLGCANTVSGYRKLWSSVGDDPCIIYFFGHATGKELLFSDQAEGKLSVSDFRSVFRRESRTERGQQRAMKVLTVLNGCLSGTGEDAESFLLATALPGFYGFIGAEAQLPNRFGLLFGHELLEALLDDGMTVGNAMTAVRERYKPYGLLYGCYAHPQLTAPANAA